MVKGSRQRLIIAGSGKLAQSLIVGLSQQDTVIRWDAFDNSIKKNNIVIHAGTGRQLPDCLAYCNRTKSVLLELSTGTDIERLHTDCPVIICPNTAISVLKVMTFLNDYGK